MPLLILLALVLAPGARAADCPGYSCENACLMAIFYKGPVLYAFKGRSLDVGRYETTTDAEAGPIVLVQGSRKGRDGFYFFTDDEAYFAAYPPHPVPQWREYHLRLELPGRGPAPFFYEHRRIPAGVSAVSVSSDETTPDAQRLPLRPGQAIPYGEGAQALRAALLERIGTVAPAYQAESARHEQAVARVKESLAKPSLWDSAADLLNLSRAAYLTPPDKDRYAAKLKPCLKIDDEAVREYARATRDWLRRQVQPPPFDSSQYKP